MRNLLPLAGTALALPLVLAAPAGAQTVLSSNPEISLSGDLNVEMDLDILGRRHDRRAYSDLYTKTELGLQLALPAGFAINGVFKLEPADRDETGANRTFYDHAAWVDELNLSWNGGPVELVVGKIHPHFGFAWDKGPGLYGTDFAEDTYELTEKMGVAAALKWSDLLGASDRIGTHEIRGELFKADTTFLSSSAFSDRFLTSSTSFDANGNAVTTSRFRNRNIRATGGPDNTSGYSNYVISANGEDVPMPVGKLEYTLGYSFRQAGQDSVDAGTAANEHGYVAGISWEIPLNDKVSLTPIGEWVRQHNADAVRDLKRDVVTAGLQLDFAPFSVAYAYEWQRDAQKGGDRDQLAQHTASISYDLGDLAPWLDGFQTTVGWRRLREDGTSANDFGGQVVYALKF